VTDGPDVRPAPPRPPLPGFAPLDVWLEPEWAVDRVGVCMPALPGAFAHAATTERALTAALTAAARVRRWLEAHGEDPGVERFWGTRVAGTVPAVREPDGYRASATFPPDRRLVGADEVEAVIRRLAWAREDLLALLDRVGAFETAHGPLPADDATGERTAVAIAWHLAGAEVWLVGRLPGGGRYDGTLDGDLGGTGLSDALVGSRTWVEGRLRALARDDDGAEHEDRHGETWTLAKVVRRLQYHGFDHLWELQRRLARADGTARRIEVVPERRPPAEDVVALLRSVGWDLRASNPDALARAIEGTFEMASAWHGERLVGTARSISDGAQNAVIAMVIVDPDFQGLGVGERMLHLLIDGRDGVRFTLAAAPGVDAWYRTLGFIPDPHAMFLPRRR